MQNFWNSITAKILFIGFLVLLMLIPNGMIQGLISEREGRQLVAIQEVGNKWGLEQEVTGPVLVIPWQEPYTVQENGETLTKTKQRYGYVLPRQLDYQATVDSQVRQRGIYEVPVYDLTLGLTGAFATDDLGFLQDKVVQWADAFISVGIPDTRGIVTQQPATINGQTVDYEPGVGDGSFLTGTERSKDYDPDLNWRIRDELQQLRSDRGFSGVHVAAPSGWNTQSELTFALQIPLKGSQALYFWPVGQETTATVDADWSSPSFDGYFLPTNTDNDEDFSNGFTADWAMSYFGRGFGQTWLDTDNQTQYGAMVASRFGVKFITPVDFYQQNQRAIKYAVLFIGLMFLAFFCFEALGLGRRLHPLQYLLVGCAMSVFYLLVLAFSEIVGFGWAYWGAALATTGLVTMYAQFILDARRKALLVGGLMIFIYGYLYTLLQLETYALVIGSIFTFIVLAGLMWVTRKIDWYKISG